ncbi:MAG TPA: hypothetical protein IAA98_13715 [Candidatus Avipropionibacterium avicola]|uniref:DUF3592 domain-containing protein n=1 Tax=Candidatus Avipropionibacterium avicola TaxID=2840701 RepID=A0A9D1H003_9ACTN|nr:hypothetical protein [Candidatus Avipropionibacterium avicola]
MSIMLIVGVLALCVLVMGGIVGLIVWAFRGSRVPGALDDSAFVNAPIGHAVVTDRDYLGLEFANSRKYRVTYQVRTADGFEFTGWQDLFLPWKSRDEFAAGTQHPVAYLPSGQTSEVRAVGPHALR